MFGINVIINDDFFVYYVCFIWDERETGFRVDMGETLVKLGSDMYWNVCDRWLCVNWFQYNLDFHKCVITILLVCFNTLITSCYIYSSATKS